MFFLIKEQTEPLSGKAGQHGLARNRLDPKFNAELGDVVAFLALQHEQA